MIELGDKSLRFFELAAVAQIGRILAWLGENCETYSLKFETPRTRIGVDEVFGIQVDFRDRCEADAFRAHFPPRPDRKLLH